MRRAGRVAQHRRGHGTRSSPLERDVHRDRGVRLREGMVLAIEPMVNAGRPEVRIKEDGWTAVTCDGRRSAHFEHSVAITEQGPFVLSRP